MPGFATPLISPLKAPLRHPLDNVVHNLLPAGSEDFVTGWSAYSGATVTVTKQTNILISNISNGGDTYGNTGGFAARTGTTLNRVTSDYWQGTGCIQAVCSGLYSNEGVNFPSTAALGSQCRFSFYIKGTAVPMEVSADYFAALSFQFTPSASEWTRVVVALPLASGANQLLKIRTYGKTAAAFYIDGLQLEYGDTVSTWNLGGCGDPFNGYGAYRIQSTGGGSVQVYYMIAAASYAAKNLSTQCWIKNIGSNTVYLQDNNYNSFNNAAGGSWANNQMADKLCSGSTVIRVASALAGNALDFLAYQPMVEQAPDCSNIWVPPGSEAAV